MVIISDCTDCNNFITDASVDTRNICKAFPKGIPDKWFWEGEPKQVKECNNGIGFEKETDSGKR